MTDPDQAEKETEAKHQANDQAPTEEDTGGGSSGQTKNPKAKKGAITDPDQEEKETKAKHQADDQNPTEEDNGDGQDPTGELAKNPKAKKGAMTDPD